MKRLLSKSAAAFAVFALTLLAAVNFTKMDTSVWAAVSVSSVNNLAQADAQKNSLTVTWDPAEGATAYNVYYKEYASDGDYLLAGTTAETTFTIANLKAAAKYSVKVEGTNGTETGYYDYLYDAVTIPDKMQGLKQEKWWFFIKKLDVCWDRQSAADGYEVVLCDDKGKTVKKQTLGGYSTNITFSKMKDKVYTVKARSYMTYNGKKYYSSWGKIYCLNQARITKINVSGNKMNIRWGKISGATGYQIYVSTSRQKGYKKVASVSKNKTSYTVKKFKNKKISSKKTYYVYVKTICNKKGSKNSSGALYYWNSKNNSYGYL